MQSTFFSKKTCKPLTFFIKKNLLLFHALLFEESLSYFDAFFKKLK